MIGFWGKKKSGKFVLEAVEERLLGYRYAKGFDLEADIAYLFGDPGDILALKAVFEKPDSFENGSALTGKLRALIEFLYLTALQKDDQEARYSITAALYDNGLYKTFYSLTLQEAMIYGLEKSVGEGADDRTVAILEWYLYANYNHLQELAQASAAQFPDMGNVIQLVNNFKRTARYYYSEQYSKRPELKRLGQKAPTYIQRQLMFYTELESMCVDTEFYLRQALSAEGTASKAEEKKKALTDWIVEVLLDVMGYGELLLMMHVIDSRSIRIYGTDIRLAIPRQIGNIFIKLIGNNKKKLERFILDDALPADYRLYALLRMVTLDSNPFRMSTWLRQTIAALKGETQRTIFTEEQEKALAAQAAELIERLCGDASGTEELEKAQAAELFERLCGEASSVESSGGFPPDYDYLEALWVMLLSASYKYSLRGGECSCVEVPEFMWRAQFVDASSVKSSGGFPTGNDYLDALQAEMLFAAYAVSLHGEVPDVDLIEFLGRLKFVFASGGQLDFILSDEADSRMCSWFRIPMDGASVGKLVREALQGGAGAGEEPGGAGAGVAEEPGGAGAAQPGGAPGSAEPTFAPIARDIMTVIHTERMCIPV